MMCVHSLKNERLPCDSEVAYHTFGDMSNNSGQKAKIEGKNEQTFGAFTNQEVSNDAHDGK